MQPSRVDQTQIEQGRDERLARDWGLGTEEWTRYEELMDGPLGIYSPNLDPLSALGVEARSDEERRRYAELQVHAESRRVEKLLAGPTGARSEEHTSELQSLMRISYAVFCLKKKKKIISR